MKADGKKPHHARNVGMAILFSLLIIIIFARAYLPIYLRDYANNVLNNIEGYRGSVADVDLALYRGAYVIHGLKIHKIDEGIPTPFIEFTRTDLSLQWGALFRGEIVGDVTLDRPVITFAKSSNGATKQDGTDTDWTVPIKALMPLDINFVEIHNGKIAWQDFSTSPNVDLYIDDMYAKATNLRNVADDSGALPSDLIVRGTSLGDGQLHLDGKLNILKQIPDFNLDAKLESVNLTAMNNYARPFAGIDFESGRLDVYSELIVQDGAISGYVKPLATNISIVDKQPDDPIAFIWESLVSGVVELFSNQSKDQFATQVELSGRIDDPNTNVWTTLGGIMRNAFGNAFSNTIKPE